MLTYQPCGQSNSNWNKDLPISILEAYKEFLILAESR